MSEEQEIDEITLKRLRNLKMFKGKTDEDIKEFWKNRDPKPEKPVKDEEIENESFSVEDEAAYNRKYQSKLRALKSEYGIDMNNSNDAESLRSLVRHIIQQEVVNKQIISLQKSEELDTRTLKNLGDYQRTLSMTVTDLQEKLGIARKQRKEKQVDDVAVFIEQLKKKSKEFFDRKTVQIYCENCEIELARYWLNFPDSTETVHFEIACWKCKEKRVYSV